MTPDPDRVDARTVIDWTRDADAVTVIDVRSPAEFETAHVAGSHNVPLTLLGEHAEQVAARLHRQVVLVCASGARAAEAQQRLAGVGADHVHVLNGGIGAYAAAGGEVVSGRARWSMERQIRFLAGSLVLGRLPGAQHAA
jgi:rhodanese-related sulfurtransferase